MFNRVIERTLTKITVPDKLVHVTPIENRDSILEKGIVIGSPPYKSLADHNAIFLTNIEDEPNTSSLFRWHSDYCIIVVDTTKLENYEFFIDVFMEEEMKRKDKSNNHVMCLQSIPAEAISEVIVINED